MTNIVILLGTLGKDVEVKQLPNGKDVANVSIATNESYKNAEWVKVDKATWHNLTAFWPTATFMGNYLTKGSKILVEWKIDNGSYEQDWVKIYTSKVIVNKVSFAWCKQDWQTAPGKVQSDQEFNKSVKNDKPVNDWISIEDIPF